ncbi:hypothetical protein [Niallia sp. Krafla_26]|uniref:hypothetical protein n=1 Tax=Niallia sp. Krafla_26 TaxID=3064703 RepID=UPI003D16669A
MDKPNERKTITIKINGKESPFIDKTKKENEEIQKVEANEKQSTSTEPVQQETAAAVDQNDENDSFEWILPKNTTPPVIEEIKPQSTSSKKKKNLPTKKSSFKTMKLPFKKINLSMFFSIFFAVLLGTFFGLMLLKIVPAEKVVDQDQPVVNNEVEAPPAGENQGGSGTLTATKQTISAAVVQEGIYSTKESAGQIKKDLNNKGIPAEVFASDQQFALYVGLSGTVEDAKLIGSKLGSSGVDTYSKQWSISEKQISKLLEEEVKTLELTPQLYQSLMTSISSVNGTNKIPQDVMDNVNKQAANLAKIDKEKLQNQHMIGIYSQLEAASAQLKVYDQNPKSSTLNMVQQHLLTFLAHYQSL